MATADSTLLLREGELQCISSGYYQQPCVPYAGATRPWVNDSRQELFAVRVSPSLWGFFLCLVTTKLTFCSVAVLLSSGPAGGTGDWSGGGGVIRDTRAISHRRRGRGVSWVKVGAGGGGNRVRIKWTNVQGHRGSQEVTGAGPKG